MAESVLLLLGGVAVIGLIIAINGYFVAQEFAYMSVDRNRLAARAGEGDAASERALKVTRRTSFMLSGAQLGITVTGLMVGYVAEPMVGRAVGNLLGRAGVPAAVSIAIGTVGVLAIATVVQMLFGELYPKNLAIANAEPMARRMSRSTLIYLAVFGWLIALFDKSANLLLRAFRIEPIHDLDTTATAEDLERIVADSRESGDLPVELSTLLDRILDFPDQDVKHAMVLPRGRVDTVAVDAAVTAVRHLMATGHTRYPVIDAEGLPVGIVHLSDVLRMPADSDTPVSDIMRAPLVVPTLMTLPTLVDELTESGERLACVVDEFGGFAGAITVEDLAEELVGELIDEHDTDVPEQITPEGDGWVADGEVHLDEVERVLGVRLPEGEYETIAGLLLAEAGELLDEGQVVTIELPIDPGDLVEDDHAARRLRVRVTEVERHVPSRVTLHVEEAQP